MIHNIESIYNKPIISTKCDDGLYKIRLHDEKISELYDGPLEHEAYVAFQKKIIMEFIDSIADYSDWTIHLNSSDSMSFCTIQTSEETFKKATSSKSGRASSKEKPFTRTKFRPVSAFPFTTRASLCIYFDNIICTKLISDPDILGERKWIVEFNMRQVMKILNETLDHTPTFADIDRFKKTNTSIIIEKMIESSDSAKWTVQYDKEYDSRKNYIISFHQF